jgi:hypothetical protein
MNDDKTLRSDLERQVREELKTENDNPISPATVNAVRQKFGLVALTLDDFASKKSGKR